MKLNEVPESPAYLVYHDYWMNGAMDVYPMPSLEEAETRARNKNEYAESIGCDDGGRYAAYVKLPRRKIWKYHKPA